MPYAWLADVAVPLWLYPRATLRKKGRKGSPRAATKSGGRRGRVQRTKTKEAKVAKEKLITAFYEFETKKEKRCKYQYAADTELKIIDVRSWIYRIKFNLKKYIFSLLINLFSITFEIIINFCPFGVVYRYNLLNCSLRRLFYAC